MKFSEFTPLNVSLFSAEKLALVRATLEPLSPAVWVEMAELGYMSLRNAEVLESVSDQDLVNICVEQVYQIISVMGGGYIYLAKGLKSKAAEKHKLIAAEFRGDNCAQLGRKYGLSTTRIYQILQEQAALKKAERTSSLIGS